jgi:lipopolysaccharide transport protein LptA
MPKLCETLRASALVLGCVSALSGRAQSPSGGDSIAWETDSFSLDRKSNVMTFEGLRITAATWNLTSDRASAFANRLDFSAGEWRFAGNVRVRLESSVLEAAEAVFRFQDQQLISAELTGAPVSFEDTAPEGDGPLRGTAGVMRYDDAAQTLELLGEVSLTVGPYLTTGCDLIYFLGTEDFTTGSEQCSVPFRMIVVPKREADAANGEPPQ